MKKLLTNHHTHSRYCDGKEPPEAYIREALRQGFHTLGFSSHAPVPFENTFAIDDTGELIKYAGEIRHLQQKYKGDINIFLALEMDYIPGITTDFAELKSIAGLDYAIGGVHLVRHPEKEELWFIDGPKREIYDRGLQTLFDGDIRYAVTAYWKQVREMVATQQFDIVAHLDKIKMHNRNRYFTQDEKWYRRQLTETLELIARKGLIVEVNTRGIYKGRSDELFPGPDALKMMRELGIPVMLNSDAHKPEELSKYFPEAREILKKIGFKVFSVRAADGWQEIGI